ncbi:Protein ecdysoneless-like [Pseudocercospora fuligena]|uniref:Protein ecdysoneless-like n=1 Tax=Pseudocercospora fuligena TaxID=685502 RepID=A0A8H6RK09_9PEZI|nr:Protein ecdysoneless-like [Pseudocercospora fuligena]
MDAQTADDGLKWFGEGFDGFPRRLPDDCVEYIIHIIDEKLRNPSAVRARLSEVLRAVNDLKKKHLKDYIWQRQHFELNLVPKLDLARNDLSEASKATPFLKGRTDFGDSVADEWLIVWLLRELSSQFPDAWTRVYDTDGEFLLIEAANALPKWLNPDIAENRVWMNAGHLKVIPLGNGSTSHNLTLQDALNFIRITPDKLLIESAVEQEAFHRLREYPSAISSSLHNALITIPRRLAYLLHRNPAYISPAIEAFYLRDPISLKPLNTKDTATLVFAPEEFVTVSVKFTKVGFAQLRSQIFDAPPAWTGVIPRLQDEKVLMGMKLACGFEILLSDLQNQDKREVREMKLLLEDIESGEEVLPDDAEISTWPQTEDDEEWLDIDYNDFEKELSGKSGSGQQATKEGFGDKGAQENLRKMVSRFEDFLKDDEAGADGIDDISESEHEQSDDDPEDDTKAESNVDDLEFQDAMRETQAMPKEQLEENGLLEEARRLALQDAEDASDLDEDEEMRKLIQAMEEELKGHGALDLSNGRIKKVKNKDKGKEKAPASPTTKTDRPFFGPSRPPDMVAKKNVSFADDDVEEIGPGEEELSSDDEDYNDVDLGLAKNMLESFKGQAGMSGPAGNLMRSLGVNMPRDEDSD